MSGEDDIVLELKDKDWEIQRQRDRAEQERKKADEEKARAEESQETFS